MLGTGSRYTNPRTGGTLEVLEMTRELLRFERLYKPRTGRADPHLHLDFTHAWETSPGAAATSWTARSTISAPGRPPKCSCRPHRDLFNPFDGETVARFEIRPCNAFVETFSRRWSGCSSAGGLTIKRTSRSCSCS